MDRYLYIYLWIYMALSTLPRSTSISYSFVLNHSSANGTVRYGISSREINSRELPFPVVVHQRCFVRTCIRNEKALAEPRSACRPDIEFVKKSFSLWKDRSSISRRNKPSTAEPGVVLFPSHQLLKKRGRLRASRFDSESAAAIPSNMMN